MSFLRSQMVVRMQMTTQIPMMMKNPCGLMLRGMLSGATFIP